MLLGNEICLNVSVILRRRAQNSISTSLVTTQVSYNFFILLQIADIVESVRAIEAETVKKCFKKYGMALEAAAQSPDPESDWEEEDLISLQELYERMSSAMELIPFEEYMSLQLPTED